MAHDVNTALQGRSAYEPPAEPVSSENTAPSSGNFTEDLELVTEPVITTIPAINSSLYQQQYDRRGYPENLASRALSRQSRRAQNDVMATVGACVRVNANGVVESHDSEHQKYPPDPTKVAAVVTENGAGFIISCMDQTISSLASIWTRTLKNRLMVRELNFEYC